VVACGRRFGKTEVGKIELVRLAKLGKRCWWLAPTYNTASQVWRELRQTFADEDGVQVTGSERRIDLLNGGLIAIRSTHNPDMLRGMGLDFTVLDEAAFMPPETWQQVVRPMLLERKGGALFLSTPHGLNWFWDVYRLGLDPEEPQWASFHFTSYDNPLVDSAEIDAIRRSTPDRVFREEYLAQFLSDGGQVFRNVKDAVDASAVPARSAHHRYVGGVDWGRDHDYTCIAIIDADEQRLVAFDRFRHIGWELQRGRLKALYDQWQPSVIWAEANSIGSVNIEALQADGLPVRAFQTTHASKAPLIEGLALAVERGDIRLLNDETLIGELISYGMTRLPGGGYRYSAPSGGHDDGVIALALAWHGVRTGSLTIDFA
jgi:phage terminase large subunit-like protein